MSLLGIVILVLTALIIVSILFVFFHIFFVLLPVAVGAGLIIWLIFHFSKPNGKTPTINHPWSGGSSPFGDSPTDPEPPHRKRARNVKTKDVDK